MIGEHDVDLVRNIATVCFLGLVCASLEGGFDLCPDLCPELGDELDIYIGLEQRRADFLEQPI